MRNRILVADDNAPVRKAVEAYLQDAGFDVCGEAADGLEAVEKAHELSPDLVLLDFSMPKMNGVQAAALLKSTLPNVRIVLFTAHSELVNTSLAATVKIDAVLSKPQGMKQLVWKLHSLLADSDKQN